METLEIEPRFRKGFSDANLTSCRAVLQRFSTLRSPAKNVVSVRPALLPGYSGVAIPIFFKQYHYRKPSWKFLWRASKAKREFSNYGAIEAVGVPCPQAVAFGEVRDFFGRLSQAFIITTAIPASTTLLEFLQEQASRAGLRSGRGVSPTAILDNLAHLTRRMHSRGFFHCDLFCRNILLSLDEDPAKLWWIDCPRGGYSTFRRYNRTIKDLASLDRDGFRLCRRSQRLRFLQIYLGKKKLDLEAKHFIRDLLAYKKRRWREQEGKAGGGW